MAQIIHNISTPNDGLGDALRTGFDHQNQMNTELYTNKVDKVTGKGLSSNDYTTAEKNKLAGIEAGAEVNVQADWLQSDNTADDYIKNKPATGSILVYGAYSLSGQDLTINAGWVWQINGGVYTNTANIVVNIPYCSVGLQRIDLIVFDTFNNVQRVAGNEVIINPYSGNIPESTILLTTVLITDSTVVVADIVNPVYVPVPKIQFTADGVQDTFDIGLTATIKAVFWNGALLNDNDWNQAGSTFTLTFIPDLGALIKPI